MAVVLAHARQSTLEHTEGGCGVRPHAIEPAAVTGPPDRDFVDEILITDDAAARDASEALVKRHVHRVEEAGDLGEGLSVVRGGLPNTCPVEVDRSAALTRPLHLGVQLTPRWQGAAEAALGQLDEECPDRFANEIQVRDGQWQVARTDRYGKEVVEELISPLLVGIEVAGG